MYNIWSRSGVILILAVLAAAGVAAIVYGIYYFWTTKTGEKRKIEESEAITIVALSFFVGVAGIIFLINQLVDDSGDLFRSSQYSNCMDSKTADGREFTEAQCEYFQDVLNGKYSNL